MSFFVDVSWSAPSADGVIAFYQTGSYFAGTPTDNTQYTIQEKVGLGFVVYSGSNISFQHSIGVSSSVEAFYKLFSFNQTGSSINYFLTNPLSGSITPSQSALQPGSQPTSFNANVPDSGTVDVSWSAAIPAPEGYIVFAQTGSSTTFIPVDNRFYTLNEKTGSGTFVVYSGSGVQFRHEILSSSISYYYDIFSFNDEGLSINYLQTSPLEGNATTSASAGASEPTAQATNFDYQVVNSGTVDISWSAPSPSTDGIIVLYQTGSVYTSEVPVDDTFYSIGEKIGAGTFVAYSGSSTQFRHAGTTGSIQYYYSIFSFNDNGSSINYLTTNPLSQSLTTIGNLLQFNGFMYNRAKNESYATGSGTGVAYTMIGISGTEGATALTVGNDEADFNYNDPFTAGRSNWQGNSTNGTKMEWNNGVSSATGDFYVTTWLTRESGDESKDILNSGTHSGLRWTSQTVLQFDANSSDTNFTFDTMIDGTLYWLQLWRSGSTVTATLKDSGSALQIQSGTNANSWRNFEFWNNETGLSTKMCEFFFNNTAHLSSSDRNLIASYSFQEYGI